jgi:hypothetical protein
MLFSDSDLNYEGLAKNDPAKTNLKNWIIAGTSVGSFTDYGAGSLYIAAFYYAVTSMTTVGYGDIRGFNLTERIVAMFLMVLGVLFFSMASGTFT